MKQLFLRLLPLVVGSIAALDGRAAPLPGTVPVTNGTSAVPGLVPFGTSFGTLLATFIAPAASFTLTSAVYRNASGTLDFYYQVSNTGSPITSLTIDNFDAAQTAVGYRTDVAPPFVPGAAIPTLAQRSNDGSTITLNFSLNTGFTGNIMVVSTDATTFTTGRAFVSNPNSFGPISTFAVAVPTPEDATTALLLGLALAALFGARTFLSKRVA